MRITVTKINEFVWQTSEKLDFLAVPKNHPLQTPIAVCGLSMHTLFLILLIKHMKK